MHISRILSWALMFWILQPLQAAQLLVPMDKSQSNHLKAYGVAYWVLQHGGEISWLLNYRGGSFLLPFSAEIQSECAVRNVAAEVLSDAQVGAIRYEIGDAAANMDEVPLQKAPKIAVYSPKNKLPWDDAVTLVLTYAEIPYDVVYDDEVLSGILPSYDWLHLHQQTLLRFLGFLPSLSRTNLFNHLRLPKIWLIYNRCRGSQVSILLLPDSQVLLTCGQFVPYKLNQTWRDYLTSILHSSTIYFHHK